MAQPRHLKNFGLTVDGIGFLGVAEKIKLPDLKRKMEAYRAAGMNGSVKADLGQEEMTAEHEYVGVVSELFKTWATSKIDGVMLRFNGAVQTEDTGAVTAVEIIMRGRHEEITMPEAEGGKKGMTKIKTALTYYKYIENGQTLIEIDLLNMVEVINGVDRLAEQRRAIGLA
jgi:P2 family phage contractile tail tube protein